MDNAWNHRLERLIEMAARHLPDRAEIRKQEWLAQFDEYPTLDAKVAFTASCLAMAAPDLLRGTLLKLARVVLILTAITLPTVWDKILADWTVLPALGTFMLLLVPSLQRQSFDAPWYPTLNLPTWVWRTSAAAWTLLLLSSIFVAHDYAFAAGFAAVLVAMHGVDAGRLKTPRVAA